jgi:hypothetical protein
MHMTFEDWNHRSVAFTMVLGSYRFASEDQNQLRVPQTRTVNDLEQE